MASNVFIFELERKIRINPKMQYPEGIFIINYEKSMVKDLWTLWNSTCSEKISLKELKTLDCEGIFLARYRNAFVGFMITDITGDVGEILAIRVAPQYRGMGIGNSLFQKAGFYFFQNKVKKILITLGNSKKIDPAIIVMAKKFGYTLIRKKRLVFNEEKEINLLKYNYIYHIIKISCHYCQNKVDFFSALILNKCTHCQKPLPIDPMAS